MCDGVNDGCVTMTDDRDAPRAAIGAYLHRRARRRGLTDDQIAAAIGKGAATVQRIHAGSVEGGGVALLRYMRLVEADPGDLYALLERPDVGLARELAEVDHPPLSAETRRLAGLLELAARDDPGTLAAVEAFIAGRRSR